MELTETFLQETLEAFRRELFSSLRCGMPGNVMAYDAETGLATVQPALRQKTSSGKVLTAPVLSGVPVLLPSQDFEVTAGSPCQLLFMDFCLDGWLETGQPVVPPSPRQHDLSDAVAIVGFFPALNTGTHS